MTSVQADGPEEMKEIKVRLWGTDIGVGISRCTAMVKANFMPSKQVGSLQLPVAPLPNGDRKRNGEYDDDQGEGPVKKESSATAAAKRKKKGAVLKQVVDLYADTADELFFALPTFNSETGEGERPTVSSLSLPPFAFSIQPSFPTTSPKNSHLADASMPYEQGSEKHSAFLPPQLTLAQKKKSDAAMIEAVNKFWKAIEEENYFQPFSRKVHRMDDLSLKGGDYNLLSETISTIQDPLNSDNEMPHEASDGVICIDVPILDALKSSIGGGAVNYTQYNTKQEINGSNDLLYPARECCINGFDEEDGDLEFLYKRLVASFILPSRASSSYANGEGFTHSSYDSSSYTAASSSSSASNEYEHSDYALPGQDDSSAPDTAANGKHHYNKKPINCGDENENDFDTGDLNNILFNDVSCTSVSENGHGIPVRTDNSISQSSIESIFTLFPSSSSLPSSSYSSCHPSHSNNEISRLSREQRTILELAELGLIHTFDCRSVRFNNVQNGDDADDENGGDRNDDMKVENGNADDYALSIPEEGLKNGFTTEENDWSTLSDRLEDSRVDDDICLSIRYLVENLKDEELLLNQRITILRKALSQSVVLQEGEARRRLNESNRITITKWQKLRKKGKPVVKLPQKTIK